MFSKHWFQCGLVVGVSLLAGGAVAASANNLYVTVSSDTAGVEAIVPVDDDFYVTTHGVCAPDFIAEINVSANAPWKLVSPSSGKFDLGIGDSDAYHVKDETGAEDDAGGRVHVLKLDIAPSETNFCWKASGATLNLTPDSALGGGTANWSSQPAGIGGSGTSLAVNPSSLTPGEYTVTAQSSIVPSYSDTCIVRIIKVDVTQAETYVCWKSSAAALNLTADSYLGDGTAEWTSVPTGISGSGTNITFNPSALSPNQYVVTARSTVLTNCSDTCTVTVIKVEIEEAGSRDSDNLQVQLFAESGGTYTYTAIPFRLYYQIHPDSGWTPDSVALKIKDSSDAVIRTQTLGTGTGEQTVEWDGKNDSGDYPECAGHNAFKAEIVVTKSSVTCTTEKPFTIFEIRQGNCVYRPIRLNLEHAAVLFQYLGGNSIDDLLDSSQYVVVEAPGGTGTTSTRNYGDHTDWLGAYCPADLKGASRRTLRKAILERCYELDDANIPYVSTILADDALIHDDDPTSPAGTGWAGSVGDIVEIRCDGLSEMGYESTGVKLYGETSWYDITGSLSNLQKHNGGWISSMTPGKQMNSSLTVNTSDSLYRYEP